MAQTNGIGAGEEKPGRRPLSLRPRHFTREITLAVVVTLIVVMPPWLLQLIGPEALIMALVAASTVAVVLIVMHASSLKGAHDWLVTAVNSGLPPPALDISDALADVVLLPVSDLIKELSTQRRDALQKADLLQRLGDLIPDPLLFVDAGFVVTETNAAARETFGLGDGPLPLARLMRDPDLWGGIERVRQSGQPLIIPIIRTDGERTRYDARIARAGSHGINDGVVLTLRESGEQLAIERMRTDFVANVSHELKTPLTAITGIAETLRGVAREDTEARDMFLDILTTESQRMTRLVEDLLSLSRLEASVNAEISTTCRLEPVMDRAMDVLLPVASSADVEIIAEGPARDLSFPADADQLHQLLCNLLDNAIKYGGPGKTVRFHARLIEKAPESAQGLAGKPALRLSICDEGPGIEPIHLPRLTERFYRVDKARSRQGGGTGLGLAIVKHIVRRHRGSLSFDSQMGQGTCVHVHLPLRARL